MMKSILILSIFALVTLSNAEPDIKPRVDPLAVNIFYDVYDQASINMMLAQNYSGVWGMMENTDVDLTINFNPMATATQAGGTYTCSGGRDTDCFATKLSACAIREHQNNTLTNHQIFHFLVCITIDSTWQNDPADSVNECVNQINEWPDDFVDILMCARYTDSQAYLDAFYQAAQAAQITTVPTVQIGGNTIPNGADDLKATVCANFQNGQPAECTDTGSSTPSSGSSSSGPTSTLGPNNVYARIFYNVYDPSSLTLLRAQNQSGVWDLMGLNRTELQINFNPLAGATKNSDGTYTCPNDPNCDVTELHACAIKQHENSIITNHQIFFFIICTVTDPEWQTSPDHVVNECSNQNPGWPDDFPSIQICSNTDEVRAYFDWFWDRIQEYNVTALPTVVINGQTNTNAVNDLLGEVCNGFTGTKPPECQGGGGGASQLVSSTILAIISLVLIMLTR